MPFAGQPSKGCQACRAKKVKCDEATPSCQRCAKAERICPGYRVQSELIFRDMTHVAEMKVRKREKARLPPPSVPTSEEIILGLQDDAIDDLQPFQEPWADLMTPINPKWQSEAVSRFLANYTLPSDVVLETLQFLPNLCGHTDLCHHLGEALHAVAFTSQGNQLGLEWLITEGSLAYGRALPLVGEAVQNQATEDSTLAATLLLGMYEAISGCGLSGTLWDFHHHYGRLSLLRARGDDQFHTQTQKSLFVASNTHLTLKCLATHVAPAADADRWLELFGKEDGRLNLAQSHIQAARLCARAQAHFDSDERTEWWVLGLLQIAKEAIVIDRQYQLWSDRAAGPWQCRELRTSSDVDMRAPTISPAPLYIYHDIWVAYAWNNYRSCRIHLHEVLLHCVELLHLHPSVQALWVDIEATRLQSRLVISDLLSDICSSVPFCLGNIDTTGKVAKFESRFPLGGYLMIWPLYVASVSAERDSPMDVWIREKLRYISDVMGIRRARVFADRPRKDSWNLG